MTAINEREIICLHIMKNLITTDAAGQYLVTLTNFLHNIAIQSFTR